MAVQLTCILILKAVARVDFVADSLSSGSRVQHTSIQLNFSLNAQQLNAIIIDYQQTVSTLHTDK